MSAPFYRCVRSKTSEGEPACTETDLIALTPLEGREGGGGGERERRVGSIPSPKEARRVQGASREGDWFRFLRTKRGEGKQDLNEITC